MISAKNKLVKVIWRDAVVFNSENIPSSPSIEETTGILIAEESDYVLIRQPRTRTIGKNKMSGFVNSIFSQLSWWFKSHPTFFYIPKGMIDTLEVINK